MSAGEEPQTGGVFEMEDHSQVTPLEKVVGTLRGLLSALDRECQSPADPTLPYPAIFSRFLQLGQINYQLQWVRSSTLNGSSSSSSSSSSPTTASSPILTGDAFMCTWDPIVRWFGVREYVSIHSTSHHPIPEQTARLLLSALVLAFQEHPDPTSASSLTASLEPPLDPQDASCTALTAPPVFVRLSPTQPDDPLSGQLIGYAIQNSTPLRSSTNSHSSTVPTSVANSSHCHFSSNTISSPSPFLRRFPAQARSCPLLWERFLDHEISARNASLLGPDALVKRRRLYTRRVFFIADDLQGPANALELRHAPFSRWGPMADYDPISYVRLAQVLSSKRPSHWTMRAFLAQDASAGFADALLFGASSSSPTKGFLAYAFRHSFVAAYHRAFELAIPSLPSLADLVLASPDSFKIRSEIFNLAAYLSSSSSTPAQVDSATLISSMDDEDRIPPPPPTTPSPPTATVPLSVDQPSASPADRLRSIHEGELDRLFDQIFSPHHSRPLLSALVLLMLNFDGLSSIITIWSRFTTRLADHWQAATPLPGVSSDPSIPCDATLLSQKLHLLNLCILRRIHPSRCLRSSSHSDSNTSYQIPMVQIEGPMTSDMIEERSALLSDLGSSAGAARLRARMQAGPLLSDMSSFKHANPGCSLAHFVQWHSPNDWRDGALSGRMTEPGNLWVELWEDAEPLAAQDQPPLFDHRAAGEASLAYLTGAGGELSPMALISQLLREAASQLAAILAALPDSAQLPTVRLAAEQVQGALQALSAGEESPERVFEELNTLEIVLARAQSLFQKLTSFSPAVVDQLLAKPDQEVLLHPAQHEGHRILIDYLLKTSIGQRQPDVVEFIIEKFVSLLANPREAPFVSRNRLYLLLSDDEIKMALKIESFQ